MPAIAYFITFSTYGTWLHGNNRGSVDREHNEAGTALMQPKKSLERYCQSIMNEDVFTMDETARRIVRKAIQQHAEFRNWQLHAVHVRTNHVHIVVTGGVSPERMLLEFKAYATRELKKSGNQKQTKFWTRHGSTRWLDTDFSLKRAVQYTVGEQGIMMECYFSTEFRDRVETQSKEE